MKKTWVIALMVVLCASSVFSTDLRTGLVVTYDVPVSKLKDRSYDDTLLEYQSWSPGIVIGYGERLLGLELYAKYEGNWTDSHVFATTAYSTIGVSFNSMWKLRGGLGVKVRLRSLEGGLTFLKRNQVIALDDLNYGNLLQIVEPMAKLGVRMDTKPISSEFMLELPILDYSKHTLLSVIGGTKISAILTYMFP